MADEIEKTKTSVFRVFSRFKTPNYDENGKPIETVWEDRLRVVIDTVRKEAKSGSDTKKIKRKVIDKLKGHKHWHYLFFNIFGYKHLIGSQADDDLIKFVFQKPKVTYEDWEASQGGKRMTAIIDELMKPLQDKKFYYSIPIKPDGKQLIANPFVSGKSGFSEDFFGDKFYISLSPESGSLFLDIQDFLNAVVKSEVEKTEVKEVKKEPKKTTKKKEEVPSVISSTEEKLNTVVTGILEGKDETDVKQFLDNFNFWKPLMLSEQNTERLEARLSSKPFKSMNNAKKLVTLLQDLGITIQEKTTGNKTSYAPLPLIQLEKQLNDLGINGDVVELRKNLQLLLKQC